MDDIHSTFDELQKTLNVRKSVLLMELEVNYGLKHKVSLRLFSWGSRERTYVWGQGRSLLSVFQQQQRGLRGVLKCHRCTVSRSFHLVACPAFFSLPVFSKTLIL